MRLKNIESTVRFILEDHPEARDSDDTLYYLLVSQSVDKLPSVKTLFTDRERLEIPSYESVGRCRRKLQAKNEELRGSKYATRFRRQKEEEFIAYALDDED